jgi:hypothetical protein
MISSASAGVLSKCTAPPEGFRRVSNRLSPAPQQSGSFSRNAICTVLAAGALVGRKPCTVRRPVGLDLLQTSRPRLPTPPTVYKSGRVPAG